MITGVLRVIAPLGAAGVLLIVAFAAPGVTHATVREIARASLCLINKLRQQRHLRALKDSPQLQRAANQHARNMVAGRYFSHDTPGPRRVGTGQGRRIRARLRALAGR